MSSNREGLAQKAAVESIFGFELDAASGPFQSLVRADLENVILALVIKQPMCGIDMIKTIHARFGLLLSPGTIYPLLHDLERQGLVRHSKGTKTKIYAPAKGMKEKICSMLRERVRIRNLLNQLLLSAASDADL